MKILITNDDGILAPGLAALLSWARTSLPVLWRCEADITVIAPLEEQSGKSQGIELRHDVQVRRVVLPDFPDVTAYGVGSTPADCVRFGVCGLEDSYDLVLSGINRGYNIGGDLVYSGTVGAVLEASSTGIPAIALSMDFSAFGSPGGFGRQGAADAQVDMDPASAPMPAAADPRVPGALDMAFQYLTEHHLMSRHKLYNINMPLSPLGVRITRQGLPYYLDHFRPVEGSDDHYRQIGYCAHINRHDPTLDTDSVIDGYISILPMTLDHTDIRAYEKLS